ncbi:MAG: TetR/AcrR family transcriptional regulator [Acidimicrobiales bacterium]
MSTPGRAVTPRRRASPKKAGPGASRGGAPAQERDLRAQGKKTMRKLLDAAMVVFEKRGYHAARVDDIVKVARTSHGTFYLYFANKEDLFRALVVDVAEELNELASSLPPISPDQSGYEELRSWLGRFGELYDHYGPVVRAWTEAEVQDTEFGRLGSDITQAFIDHLVARIGEADTGGAANPQIAAVALVAMIERFNYYLSSRNLAFERDEVLDTLTGFVHAGLFAGTHLSRRRPRARRRSTA